MRGRMILSAVLLTLVGAADAHAASVTPYCDYTGRCAASYEAYQGERNTVELIAHPLRNRFVSSVPIHPLAPRYLDPGYALANPPAVDKALQQCTYTVFEAVCQHLSNLPTQVFTGDADDTVTVTVPVSGSRGSLEILVSAGRGNDRIHARNGNEEYVACGDGFDAATVDASDRVSGCEQLDAG